MRKIISQLTLRKHDRFLSNVSKIDFYPSFSKKYCSQTNKDRMMRLAPLEAEFKII